MAGEHEAVALAVQVGEQLQQDASIMSECWSGKAKMRLD